MRQRGRVTQRDKDKPERPGVEATSRPPPATTARAQAMVLQQATFMRGCLTAFVKAATHQDVLVAPTPSYRGTPQRVPSGIGTARLTLRTV